ncbi:unnamed protein product [Phytophthora lilii]|uniref:Unnamed protein product n=1 Tax=Phytophthora lilii TaxID=2077276 RepID=A0A9W6X533_9STRA|nr:unnamed protein product [Phytophthora lilii]
MLHLPSRIGCSLCGAHERTSEQLSSSLSAEQHVPQAPGRREFAAQGQRGLGAAAADAHVLHDQPPDPGASARPPLVPVPPLTPVAAQCCIAGVLVGIPISIQRKSYKPFAILGVLGSFVDYSIPYTTDCRMIHNAMQLALQQERQRDAPSSAADEA